MAGAQAHNRWLAEFVQNPERHCGVALLPITADPDKVVAEVHARQGVGARRPDDAPSMWVDKDPYHARRYDPDGRRPPMRCLW